MNRELIKNAQDALAVVDVYLRECHSSLSADYDPKSESAPKLVFQHKFFAKQAAVFKASESEKDIDSKIVRYYVSTGLRLLPADLIETEKEPDELAKQVTAEITAEFVSEYKMTNPDLTQEAIEEFGKYNTMLHVWPYWRELIQNMCARMRLAQIVLPMYRVPSGQKSGEPAALDTEKERNV